MEQSEPATETANSSLSSRAEKLEVLMAKLKEKKENNNPDKDGSTELEAIDGQEETSASTTRQKADRHVSFTSTVAVRTFDSSTTADSSDPMKEGSSTTADNITRTDSSAPIEEDSSAVADNIAMTASSATAKASDTANSKPDRVHPEAITSVEAGGKHLVDGMNDKEVALDAEMTAFNSEFLVKESKVLEDQDVRPDRQTYTPGAPDYASPEVTVPGPDLSEASSSPVEPAGIRMGDARLPRYLEIRSDRRYDIGHYVMPEAHCNVDKLYTMADTEDEFVVTGMRRVTQ